jgi:hypothetical protein
MPGQPGQHRNQHTQTCAPPLLPQDPTVCHRHHHNPPATFPTPPPKAGCRTNHRKATAMPSFIDIPPMSHPPDNTRARSRYFSWQPPTITHTDEAVHCEALLRKEVIQPHLPVRLPCYDLVPIAGPTFDGSLPTKGVRPPASGVTNFRDLTGGVYKARERIHRSVADLRLLATPTSRGRVADHDPN